MSSSRRDFLETGAELLAAAVVLTSRAAAADGYVPFEGEKTTWHEGFDRYDFIMDDATGCITSTPRLALPASEVTSFGIDTTIKDGKRRCVVIAPRKSAPGSPWSWRACYWNHQPQTEVELLKRGFHVGFATPDPGRQGKAWDLWYKFMTETHGLGKKPAFIGMSKGGVNAFNWGRGQSTPTRWLVSTRIIPQSLVKTSPVFRSWPGTTYPCCTLMARRILMLR